MTSNDRSHEIVVTTGFFLTLAWICVSLRIYVRAVMLKSFGIDDWLIFIAMLLFTGASTLIFVGAFLGVGRHRDVLPVAHYVLSMELWYFDEMVYGATILFTKISIALYLKRIAIQKKHIIMINVAVGASTIFSIFFLFYLMFQCQPINYFWTKYGDGVGTCRPSGQTGAAIYAFSGVNAFVDFIVALVPWLVVKDLEMNFRTKFSVVIVLTLGSMASIATVLRIPYLHNLTEGGDFLWSTADVTIWSAVEMGLGITAASMATLKPLFKTLLHSLSSYNHSRSKFTDLEGGEDGNDRSKYLSKNIFKMSRSNRPSDLHLDHMKHPTLVTIIEAGESSPRIPDRIGKVRAVSGIGKWDGRTGTSGNSDSTDDFGSSPLGWGAGIMKTTRVDVDTQARSVREAL